jgi:hypothetical protein
MGLHTYSSSLILSSSFHVKHLTRRCYVWNSKDYKFALTLLNFQGGIKSTNYNSSCTIWTLHNYYSLLSVAVYLDNYWVIQGHPSLNFLPLLEIKWRAHIKSLFLHLIFFPCSSTHPHQPWPDELLAPSTSTYVWLQLPYCPPSRPGSKIHRMRVLTWVIHKINFEYTFVLAYTYQWIFRGIPLDSWCFERSRFCIRCLEQSAASETDCAKQ